MNNNNHSPEYISQLLDRYYCGEASLIEEQTLRAYFAGDNTDPAFDTDKAMFAAIDRPVSAPSALREAVESAIRLRHRTELRQRLRSIYSRVAGAAAVLLISVAVSVHFLSRTPVQQELTPEQARQQTIMALTLLTTSVNKGLVAMEQSAQTANESFGMAQRVLNNKESKN